MQTTITNPSTNSLMLKIAELQKNAEIQWLDQLALCLNCRFSICKLSNLKYLYYNMSSQKQLNKFINESFSENISPLYFFQFMKPSDAKFIRKTMDKGIDHLRRLNENERMKYKIIFDVCLKNTDDKWCRVVHQSVLFNTASADWTFLSFSSTVNESCSYSHALGQMIHIPSVKFCWSSRNTNYEILKLTPREIEILQLIAQGQDSAAIATALFISKFTVLNHRQNILGKLNFKCMNTAVCYAQNLGII